MRKYFLTDKKGKKTFHTFKKRRKKTPKRKLQDECDGLWSVKVKERAGFKCEVPDCPKTAYLHAHHIYSRSNKAVRWDLDNGICLCSGHHVLEHKFSAHKSPLEFTEFIIKLRRL